jgi:hypothetical protein
LLFIAFIFWTHVIRSMRAVNAFDPGAAGALICDHFSD